MNALAKHRRQDGWTSTHRAGRGATAETTPKAPPLLLSPTWTWGYGPACLSALLVPFSTLVRLPSFASLPFLRWVHPIPYHVRGFPFGAPHGCRWPSAHRRRRPPFARLLVLCSQGHDVRPKVGALVV